MQSSERERGAVVDYEARRHGQAQRERIVAFIRDFRTEHGYGPSLEEIGAHIGVASINSVRQHLRRLEAEGRIRLQRGIPRAISLVEQ